MRQAIEEKVRTWKEAELKNAQSSSREGLKTEERRALQVESLALQRYKKQLEGYVGLSRVFEEGCYSNSTIHFFPNLNNNEYTAQTIWVIPNRIVIIHFLPTDIEELRLVGSDLVAVCKGEEDWRTLTVGTIGQYANKITGILRRCEQPIVPVFEMFIVPSKLNFHYEQENLIISSMGSIYEKLQGMKTNVTSVSDNPEVRYNYLESLKQNYQPTPNMIDQENTSGEIDEPPLSVIDRLMRWLRKVLSRN